MKSAHEGRDANERSCASGVSVERSCASRVSVERSCASGTSPAGEAAALAELAARGRQRILVVYEHVPDAESSGADLRLFQIVEILAHAGHELVLVGRTPRDDVAARARLAGLGVEVLAPDPERIFWETVDAPSIELERRLAEQRFDVALLYAYFWVGLSVAEQYADLVRAASPTTRILLLSDDCHWLREERRAAQEGNRTVLERSRGLRAKELDSYRRADLLLTITDDDRARMLAAAPDLDPFVVTFCQADVPAAVAGFEDRSGLLFLGSGGNDANRKAVEWFVRAILPLVRRRVPSIELALVGEPPPDGWGFEGVEGVVVHGRIADLEPCFARARVFVSPVTYGTGLKTKNVQALGHGLPIVATTISVEGMHLDADGAALVRDDAEAFAAAVVLLHGDRARWEAGSQAALAHARSWFGRERVVRDLARAWSAAFERTPKPRDPRPAPADVAGRAFPERIASKKLAGRYAAHVELARGLRSSGRLGEAEQELRNVFCELCCFPIDSPVFAEPHALLATIYLARGAHVDAAAAAEEALRLAPDLEPSLRLSLARVVEVARARDACADETPSAERSAGRPEPKGAHASVGSSESCAREPAPTAGASDVRETECTIAAETIVGPVAASIADARAAFTAGDVERALELCTLALDHDPTSVDAWNDLGVVLHAVGEVEEALHAFDRALAGSPDHRDARANRAHVRAAAGRYIEARLDVDALLGSDPADADAIALGVELDRALAREREGDLAEAHATR